MYHARVFEVFFENSIFSAEPPPGRRAADPKKNFIQIFRNNDLGKVKKFGYPIFSRLEAVNNFIWPRVNVTPPPSLNRVKAA